MYDFCVVGGGLSGLVAAASLLKKDKKVLIIEKEKKIGKKLYATGNGRCNVTNDNLSFSQHYFSSGESLGEYAAFWNEKIPLVKDFFNSIGALLYSDDKGYVYPCSNQASSVVWALKDACDKADIYTETICTAIEKKENTFRVNFDGKNKGKVEAKNVILALGGASYKELGGTENFLGLPKSFNLKCVEPLPSLCSLMTDSLITKAAGARAKTYLSLLIDDEKIIEEKGELQITEYGLSGIVVFNVSSPAIRALSRGNKVELELDLLPNLEEKAVEQLVENYPKERTLMAFLCSLVNEKIAAVILEKSGLNHKDKIEGVNKELLKATVTEMKHFRCLIKGDMGFDKAQVTQGGVDLSEIDKENFECKKIPGLFIVGEMLDVDGICGGYNITFGALSGILLAESFRG